MCYAAQPGEHMQRESEEVREAEAWRRKVKRYLERERKRELFQWPGKLDKRQRNAQCGGWGGEWEVVVVVLSETAYQHFEENNIFKKHLWGRKASIEIKWDCVEGNLQLLSKCHCYIFFFLMKV